jgi:ubiquinone biosynthesis UbiH/UbiF/VisC/COQ6 family hydroxylase
MKSLDIIVAGGGMVGMAVANALAQSDFKVAVIESREPQSFDISQDYDLRVSAVTLETVDFLKNIDVWNSIIETRTCPLKAMRVWEESGFGDVTFDAKTIGEDNIGYIVENRILQLALWEKAKSDANIKIFCPETHKNIHVDNDQVEVTLSNDEKIYSKLLVGADGARSSIREQFSFGVKSKQYDQSCLVANVSVVNNSQNITWQRFTPSGSNTKENCSRIDDLAPSAPTRSLE